MLPIVRRSADTVGGVLVGIAGLTLLGQAARGSISQYLATDITTFGTVVLGLIFLTVCFPRAWMVRGVTSLALLILVAGMVLVMEMMPHVPILTAVSFMILQSGAELRVRRIAGAIVVVCLTLFLPVPGLVFGEPSVDPERLTRFSVALVAAFSFLAIEATTFLSERLSAEQSRNSRFSDTIEKLTNVNVGFQQYSRDVEIRSKQEERNRITRELHDTVGYALTNISVMLDAAMGLLNSDRGRARKLLQDGREQVDTAHEEVRRALYALRSLDRHRESGLTNLLRLGKRFEEVTGVAVEINRGNCRQTFGGLIDAILVRLIQEGLANAFRHGRATSVEIFLWEVESILQINIHDNGTGSEVVEEGIGFLGMRERLSQVGGTLSWTSLPNGFVLTASIELGSAGR